MYTGVCDSRNPYPVLQWCLTHAGWITSTQKQQPFYPQSHSVNSLGKEQANFPSYSCLLQNKHDIPFQSHCYSSSQLPSLPMEEKKKNTKHQLPPIFIPCLSSQSKAALGLELLQPLLLPHYRPTCHSGHGRSKVYPSYNEEGQLLGAPRPLTLGEASHDRPGPRPAFEKVILRPSSASSLKRLTSCTSYTSDTPSVQRSTWQPWVVGSKGEKGRGGSQPG